MIVVIGWWVEQQEVSWGDVQSDTMYDEEVSKDQIRNLEKYFSLPVSERLPRFPIPSSLLVCDLLQSLSLDVHTARQLLFVFCLFFFANFPQSSLCSRENNIAQHQSIVCVHFCLVAVCFTSLQIASLHKLESPNHIQQQ